MKNENPIWGLVLQIRDRKRDTLKKKVRLHTVDYRAQKIIENPPNISQTDEQRTILANIQPS